MHCKAMDAKASIPLNPDWPGAVREKAARYMESHDSCVQAILAAFMEDMGMDDPLVMRSAGALHGGMLSSLVCGVHTGGLMVLGLIVGRPDVSQGFDGLLPAVLPAQELVQRLTKRLGSSSCRELSGVDFTDLNAAMAFRMSPDSGKCRSLVEEGADEIARFLQEKEKAGELFRPF